MKQPSGNGCKPVRLLVGMPFFVIPSHISYWESNGLELHGGTGLNLTNRHSVDVIQQYGVSDTLLSVELTIRQALSCCDRLPAGIFAYGHLPVMKTRLCPIREEVGCRSCKHQLKDRTNRTFLSFAQRDTPLFTTLFQFG